MAKKDLLQTFEMDTDKNILKVNGRDISGSTKRLIFEFEDGEWSLMITEDTIYGTSDRFT